jgi:hydroxypyruvate isomerase
MYLDRRETDMFDPHKQKTLTLNRRRILGGMAGGIAAAALGRSGRLTAAEAPSTAAPPAAQQKGRIKQAACMGAFGRANMEERSQTCIQLGLLGIDMVDPKDWPILKKYGLICTMVNSATIAKGLNRLENHDEILAILRKSIEDAANNGYPNVICFSGNRAGISDDVGLRNCAEGLKKIAPFAEEKKVTLCMELLNSKRNHKDYQCDRTAWGAELCQKVGSPRFKLLYDIYHMQVQEGDVIATIRENIRYIGHIHTAGVPGRNEIDESQELYYPAIMQAIAELKFEGYVAHEYSPKGNALESLKKAVSLCDA